MTDTRELRASQTSLGERVRSIPSRTWALLAAVLLAHLLVTAVILTPQLSPRLSGTEVTLRVAPVDPIDPFRGAYVDLDYPDLPQPRGDGSLAPDKGTAYVPLTQEGDIWVGGPLQRAAPAEGLYLKCSDRGWRLECGINSWFAAQDTAYRLEQDLRDEGALATIRVDRWGNATITQLTPAAGG